MSRNIEAPRSRRKEIRTRNSAGKITSVTIIIPRHSEKPQLNLPQDGLKANLPQLNLSEPVWIAPHLRKPSWKKRHI